MLYVVLSMGAVAIYAFAIANPHENVSWTGKATRLGLPVGILSLIADLAVFFIPFAAIIPLQINHKKRFGALLIFLTGGRYVRIFCKEASETEIEIIVRLYALYAISAIDGNSSTAKTLCGMVYWEAYSRESLSLVIGSDNLTRRGFVKYCWV